MVVCKDIGQDTLGELAMSVLVRFNPASLTKEQYEESVRRLREAVPVAGLDYHVCSGATGRLKVTEKVQP